MTLLDNIWEILQNLLQRLLQVLPKSPFKDISASIANSDYLGYLNWFFPVSEVLSVMTAWLAAIALFYLWSVLARWVKLIGD